MIYLTSYRMHLVRCEAPFYREKHTLRVGDLIWVGDVQSPFEWHPEYKHEDGTWTIPSELHKIVKLKDMHHIHIYSPASVQPNNPKGITGIYIEDIVQNLSHEKRRQIAVHRIQRCYRRWHQRRVSAQRTIYFGYMKHIFCNPNKEICKKRLWKDWEELKKLSDIST